MAEWVHPYTSLMNKEQSAFSRHDFDEETELHYNIFRYYDKQIARFTIERPDWFIRKEESLLINLILLLKLISVDYYS
ncbi:hypothetical protein [Gilliamella apicola]|uniref:hypothetical protein n=1 Tax=Gilliamella apicola TaxID=1196095 RepID=UPI0011836E76|nr:hypothetical protein [Gilliamella apicola]